MQGACSDGPLAVWTFKLNGPGDDQLTRLVRGSQRADLQWAALLGKEPHSL